MLRCLLVDDEPLALGLLERYVEKTPFLELAGTCSNAIDALKKIEEEDNIDLLFLDIQMPNLTGIDLSKMIDPSGPKIIFTTAFSEFAIESYKINALDYLLKPISYTEFFAAANKAKNRINSLPVTSKPIENNSIEDYIFVKSDYKLIKIEFKDLVYVEALKDYLKLYRDNDEKPILTLKSMKSLEEELPSNFFMRIHRSYIVNLKKVTIVDRNRIVFDKKYIPISEKYKENFQKFLKSESI